jgi:hypothetical protein
MGSKRVIPPYDANGNGVVIDDRTLEDAQAEVVQRIEDQFLARLAAGFNYTGPDGVARTFQIDPTSQFNIDVQANAALGAIVNNEFWHPGSYFIDANNDHMSTPTAQDMRAFAQAARLYVATLILTRRALKDLIGTLPSIAACDAFDDAQGWPANP